MPKSDIGRAYGSSNLEIIRLNKITQTVKVKYYMFSPICRILFLKINDKNVKQVLFVGWIQPDRKRVNRESGRGKYVQS
jgi:hypothetical protein